MAEVWELRSYLVAVERPGVHDAMFFRRNAVRAIFSFEVIMVYDGPNLVWRCATPANSVGLEQAQGVRASLANLQHWDYKHIHTKLSDIICTPPLRDLFKLSCSQQPPNLHALYYEMRART
jgi:hypothetical protein